MDEELSKDLDNENTSDMDGNSQYQQDDNELDDISMDDLSPVNDKSTFYNSETNSDSSTNIDDLLKTKPSTEKEEEEEEETPTTTDELDKLQEALSIEQNMDNNSINPQTDTKSYAVDALNGDYNQTATEKKAGLFSPLTYRYEPTLSFDDEVENSRLRAIPKIKKQQILSIIAMFLLVLGLLAVILPTILQNLPNAVRIVLFVVGIVTIVGGAVLTFITRKMTKKVMMDWSGKYFDLLSGYTVQDIGLEKPMTCHDGSMDELLFIQAHLYRTITTIQSVSVLEAERHNKSYVGGLLACALPELSIEKANQLPTEFFLPDGNPYIEGSENPTVTGSIEINSADVTMVDMDVVKNAEKINNKAMANQPTSSLLGMYGWFTSYDMRVESEQSIILYFMGSKENNRLPDYLTGFKAMKITGLKKSIVVYGATPAIAGQYFTQKIIDELNEFIIDDYTTSAFISINSFGSKLGLNLADPVVSTPDKTVETGAYNSYYANTKIAFEFFDAVEDIASKLSVNNDED